MRPQETRMIRGGRLSRVTVSMPSSVPGNCQRYSARWSGHPGGRIRICRRSRWPVAVAGIYQGFLRKSW